MPCIREVARLTDTAVNCIAKTLIQILLNIEDRNEEKGEDCKALEDSDINDVIEYLDGLNFHTTDPLFQTVLQLYAESFKLGLKDAFPNGLGQLLLDILPRHKKRAYRDLLQKEGRIEIRTPKLISVLRMICKNSSIHVDLTGLTKINRALLTSDLFTSFHQALSDLIPKMNNLKEINLANVNSKQCLPQIKNEHVKLIGQNCPNLESINICHHKNITWDGVAFLGESQDSNIKSGCLKLKVLQMFETGVFPNDVAKLVVHLPNLRFLGYKETGRVIKALNMLQKPPKLKLTHVDNRGSRNRPLNFPSLRCKRTLLNALINVCPALTNLKLRVADTDVAGLVRLENIRSMELVYHVGKILTPGDGTQTFLRARGNNLTSLTIYCQHLTAANIKCIAESCVNMEQLWIRANHYLTTEQDDLPKKHNHLNQLRTLYLRIGLNDSMFDSIEVPVDVIPYLTMNGPLKELIIGVRSYIINDQFICNLLRNHNLVNIEKILFMVPGTNNSNISLNVTEVTVDYVLANCEKIKKLGNLHVWNLDHDYKRDLHAKVKDQNWDLDVVDGSMILR